MGVFDMVALIVVVGCVTGVINTYLKNRHETFEARDDEVFEKLEALEDRVQVLERVVTDDRSDLKREIDRL